MVAMQFSGFGIICKAFRRIKRNFMDFSVHEYFLFSSYIGIIWLN